MMKSQRYEYHKWANKRIFDRLDELPSNVYGQEINSIFTSISAVMAHVYQVDVMWLSVMSENSFDETMAIIKTAGDKVAGCDLDGMKGLYREAEEQYDSFLQEQRDLTRILEIEHPNFGKLTSRIIDLLEHVVNHGTYHRGNISAMLRQQGHAGIPTDYIFFLYEMQHSG